MNELVKRSETALIKNLNPVASKIIERALAPKVKDIEPIEVLDEFTTIITTAYTIAGQQADDFTLALYCDEFYKKLMETFPFITIEEVKVAIRSGVYEEYGEYFGLNPKSFLMFVKSYLNSPERKDAKNEYQKPLMISNKLSPAEAEKRNKGFANLLYNDFRNGSLKMEFIPTFIYDFLSEKGIIDLCTRSKNNYLKRAKIYIAKERFVTSIYGKMINNVNGESLLVITSKQIVVWDYFELCKLFGGENIF